MAGGWMKSLQCKSRAVDDVASRRCHRNNHHSNSKNNRSHQLSLSNSANCRNSVQNLKDIVEITKPRKTKPAKTPQAPPSKEIVSRKPDAGTKESINRSSHSIVSGSGWLSRAAGSFFPALTELQEAHSSRNVVEIIFHTSWGTKKFPGRIEMVFKVQNLARTVARFEDYRERVKSRARSRSTAGVNGRSDDQARCSADGNEVMRFHCLGATKGAYDTGSGGGACTFHGDKMTAMRTFSEAGGAHENAGGGRGRKAMLISRVIAGRICKQIKFDSLTEWPVGYDTVSGENGELLVFDSRALLPCFLVTYKL